MFHVASPMVYTPHPGGQERARPQDYVQCNWPLLCGQMLLQWKKLSRADLDETGRKRRDIALLIQQKYGIASELVENYLRNLERCLPL